jgi:hypothetical protein
VVAYDADVYFTSLQLIALRAVDRTGIPVDAKVVDRATTYLRRCQNRNGSFGAMPFERDGDGFEWAFMPFEDACTRQRRHGGNDLPATAVGAAALQAWGKLDGQRRTRALSYLAEAVFGEGEGEWKDQDHFYFAACYLGEALWHAGGQQRHRDLPLLRNALLLRQRPDGSWADEFPDYATAMALIALQAPEERLGLAKPPAVPERDAPKPPKPAKAQADAADDVRKIAATYRDLKLMTKDAVSVDPGLAGLCRGITRADAEAARKQYGPHAHTQVRIFMNHLAAGEFGKRNPTFPVGSVIVKEKTAVPHTSTTRPGKTVKGNDGVGGMIKRADGYDLAHGDWEYFYFEDPASIESGKLASCVKCHSGAPKTDYVFGGWAPRN